MGRPKKEKSVPRGTLKSAKDVAKEAGVGVKILTPLQLNLKV